MLGFEHGVEHVWLPSHHKQILFLFCMQSYYLNLLDFVQYFLPTSEKKKHNSPKKPLLHASIYHKFYQVGEPCCPVIECP